MKDATAGKVHLRHRGGISDNQAGGGDLALGIDIGSVSSDVVLLDRENNLVYSSYRRTQGRGIAVLCEQLREVFGAFAARRVGLVAVTGDGARHVAELLGAPFVNEVPAQAAAIAMLYPELEEASVIEMGGQDSKLIFLERQQGRLRIRDFALNTACAAGTGSFLDQQAQRLGVAIEEFGQLALQSRTAPRMAGRCSVFAKSDMIHLQQQATPECDIVAGLAQALARSLKSNLGCGREFPRPILFTGGVAANAGVVRAFEEVFELEAGALRVPKEHFFTGAIGAILSAREKHARYERPERILGTLEESLGRMDIELLEAPRRPKLKKPTLPLPTSRVYSELLDEASEPVEAYLGVDVGSISTNVVIMDAEKRVLAKEYLMTAGRPIAAVRQGLEQAAAKVGDRVRIVAAATTGSGRYLTGDLIGADIIINEITAQAAGATIVNPRVDTIFEIGGQDSKYISLQDGVVVDFEMNHACAAGTGSFLEEQAQRLGISIKEEFARLAFAGESPLKLGERCTVFIESDLIGYQQLGAGKEDLIAGLSYSIVSNYLNRVVGRRRIGDNICFQGGTAFNQAVWAAFEQIVGKPVMVPDHHEVTGALGAAAIAMEHRQQVLAEQGAMQTRFRGFENLTQAQYEVETFTCHHCSNDCEIKKVTAGGSEPLYYGSRCDRYNVRKRRRGTREEDAFDYRQRRLAEFAGISGHRERPARMRPSIGIPRALIGQQLLPLFGRFFDELGFDVVVSQETNKRMVRRGVEAVPAQPCFPVKVAYGHVLELLDKGVEYVFLPSVVSMPRQFENNEQNRLCPYVQSFAYQVRSALGERLGETKLLTEPLVWVDGVESVRRSFVALGKQLGLRAGEVKKALAVALEAQQGFEESLRNKGREILAGLGEDERLFVLISRPYNGCDPGVNLELPKKFAELGARMIPLEMLDLGAAELSGEHEEIHDHMYWSYGQKILRAAEVVKKDPRLFSVYLSNFSCGPDSFLQSFFQEVMSPKPALLLELDEHSADAGVITRIEAFLESLKHYQPQGEMQEAGAIRSKPSLAGRRLYVPYMGDPAYGMAAALRGYGVDAHVMPVADDQTLRLGRQFTTGKECLPCAITIGEMVRITRQEGFDPARTAFFMPSTSGPCRFGMYNAMQKLVLKQQGLEDVVVIAPNQDVDFYQEFGAAADAGGGLMKWIWTAAAGVDLLVKMLLRLRPAAVEPERIAKVYGEALDGWIQRIQGRVSMSELVRYMDEVAQRFSLAPLRAEAKPRIGIVGEIYVRHHPFANNQIISRLEGLGAACELASLSEWIYYTNFTRAAGSRRVGNWAALLRNLAEDFVQHRIEQRLARPLERRFGPLAEEPLKRVLEMAEPYIHPSFEGEAILSVGKIVEMHHHGVDGVVNVMPFTCMPSTIVSTQTTRLSRDCDGMPILNITFDGQQDPTLATRLEAFVDQVRQRKQVAEAAVQATN